MMKTVLFLFTCIGLQSIIYAQCIEPEIPVLSSSDSSICLGGASFLSVDTAHLNDATQWIWRKDSCTGAIVDSGSAIFVFPSQTTTYYVKGEGACTGQTICAEITVQVLPNPNPTIYGNDTICLGQTAELYINNGPFDILWSDNTTDTSFSANPSTSSFYSLLIIDTNTQCGNIVDFEIYVHSLPNVSIFGNPTVCSGLSDTLYTSGFVSYQWSTGSTDAMIVVSPTNNTTYSVLATDTNACSSFATFDVGVIANPIMLITGDPVICIGEGSNLNASSIDSYTWSTGEISPSITVFPTTNTTYYVTGTDANGCFGVASIAINVLPIPVGQTSADTIICMGDTISLQASGGDAYLWSTGQDSSVIQTSPMTQTSYWVQIIDTNTFCSITDTIQLLIHPSITVSIIGDSIHCQNTDVTLFAQGGESYQWSTGQTSDSIIVPATFELPIYVNSTDSNTCVSSDTITLQYLPVPSITFSGSVETCFGDTTHITASGAQYFIWYNNFFGANLHQVFLESQYVSVQAINSGNGCVSYDSVLISILPLPTIQFEGDSVLCLGESSTITALGASTYEWSTGSTSDTTQISPTTTTTLTVYGQNTFMCSAFDSIEIVVNPTPAPIISLLKDTFCVQDANLTLSAMPNGGDFSGSGVFGSTFIPAVAGPGFHTMLYEYTNGFGCYGQDTAVILVQTCVGIDELSLTEQVRVFPNPGTNDVWIEWPLAQESKLRILNALGASVFEQIVFTGSNHVDVSEFTSGMYFIHLKTDQNTITIPYMITK
jgi:hypothetical protein